MLATGYRCVLLCGFSLRALRLCVKIAERKELPHAKTQRRQDTQSQTKAVARTIILFLLRAMSYIRKWKFTFSPQLPSVTVHTVRP